MFFQSLLETVDADEWLKCLERAGVDQAQVWFSLDPMKVFPSQEVQLPLLAPPLLAPVPGRRSGPPLVLPWLCLEGDISHSVGPRPCPHYNSRAAW